MPRTGQVGARRRGDQVDTLYYRKVAEIVMRDEIAADLRAAADRVLATPREGKARIAKTDRRAMKAWMVAWCDQADARLVAGQEAR